MIYPIQMYAGKCDGCGREWNNGDCITAYSDRDDVLYDMKESDWQISENGETYCPKCWDYDDKDNLVFKEMKK